MRGGGVRTIVSRQRPPTHLLSPPYQNQSRGVSPTGHSPREKPPRLQAPLCCPLCSPGGLHAPQCTPETEEGPCPAHGSPQGRCTVCPRAAGVPWALGVDACPGPCACFSHLLEQHLQIMVTKGTQVTGMQPQKQVILLCASGHIRFTHSLWGRTSGHYRVLAHFQRVPFIYLFPA